MNKICGNQSDYVPYREDRSRYIISYGLEEAPNNLYTWYEIYIYKKQKSYISFQDVKDAIIDDIDSRTTANIIDGFIWNNIPVWLSTENQFNFKAAYDLALQTNGASLPVTFKIGQTPKTYDEDGKEQGGEPIYHTFETLEDIADFYTKAFAYINKCLNEGWQKKDSIDWSIYEEALNNNNE